MVQLTEIIEELERCFPPQTQESYDNAGIQVEANEGIIDKCLVSLDVTEDVVDEAIEKKCNLIIAHHPLIFGRGLMHVTMSTPVERTINKAIKNSISIYCAHTNADSMPIGTSKVMMKKIGISDYKMLKPYLTQKFECGSGAIGDLPEEISTIDFLKKLKIIFNCDAIKHTEIIKDKVKKIAICSGSGSFLLNEAIKQGADVFVSGDFSYHRFFDADKKIVIADLGHYETEEGIKDVFVEIIKNKFYNFAVLKSEINTNPVKYL